MKKGFVIGGILIAVGLVLQATAGPVCWDSLAYPVNLTVLIAFLVLLVTAWLLRNKVYLFSWMMHLGAAVAAMSYAIALTVVMGLVPSAGTARGAHPAPAGFPLPPDVLVGYQLPARRPRFQRAHLLILSFNTHYHEKVFICPCHRSHDAAPGSFLLDR